MSLRDQLLKAGLVDKKRVKKANRELKKNRRKQQSERQKKSVVLAKQAADRTADLSAKKQARRKRRLESENRQEKANLGRLVGNLVRSYGQPVPAGHQLFFCRPPTGPILIRLKIPLEVALELRLGKQAIAWSGVAEEPQLLLLPAAAAQRIIKHDRQRLLFYNPSPPDPDDPSERLAGMDRLPSQRNR